MNAFDAARALLRRVLARDEDADPDETADGRAGNVPPWDDPTRGAPLGWGFAFRDVGEAEACGEELPAGEARDAHGGGPSGMLARGAGRVGDGGAGGGGGGHEDFGDLQDLLAEIGVEAAPPDERTLLARKDATIAELQGMLAALGPLGERLAEEELARAAAEEGAVELAGQLDELRCRLAETEAALAAARARQAVRQGEDDGAAEDGDREAVLPPGARTEVATTPRPEASAGDEPLAGLRSALDERTAEAGRLRREAKRLERRLRDREAVLARERERHAATREKLADRKRVAAERWKEILRLRQHLRDA